MSLKRFLSYTVALAVTAVTLYLAFQNVDLKGFFNQFLKTDYRYLLIALVVYFPALLLRALRWQILISRDKASYGAVFQATAAGYAANNLLPARAGEFIRSFLVARSSSIGKGFAFVTAIGERIADVFVVTAIGLVTAGLTGHMPGGMTMLHGWVILAVIVSMFLTGLFLSTHRERIFHLLEKLPAGLSRFATGLLSRIFDGLKRLTEPVTAVIFFVLSVVIWLTDTLALYMIFTAVGLQLPYYAAVLLIVALALSSVIPTTPGSLGIFQYVSVIVLGIFGTVPEQALAVIFLFQGLIYLISLTTGGPVLFSLVKDGILKKAEQKIETGA